MEVGFCGVDGGGLGGLGVEMKTAPSTRENELFAQGIFPIAGVDEAGRGPLAGPVVSCAVVLPPHCVIEGVYDSKKISPKRRAELAEKIKASALAYAFGVVEAEEIDRINILQAVLRAMREAVIAVQNVLNNSVNNSMSDFANNSTNKTLQYVLVDGNFLPDLPYPAECIIRGDAHCHLIAAASILAKEARDEIMRNLHKLYPVYGFDVHKGYGTAKHLAALAQYGACPAHRFSFKGVPIISSVHTISKEVQHGDDHHAKPTGF